MKSKKKAAHGAGNTVSGKGELSRGNGRDAYTMEFNRSALPGQGTIERLLPQGAENAVSTADLMTMAGIRSVRVFRQAVEAERKSGVLILSRRGENGGYFLPDDGEKGRDELRRYLATFTAQATSMLRIVYEMRKALALTPGQESMKEL